MPVYLLKLPSATAGADSWRNWQGRNRAARRKTVGFVTNGPLRAGFMALEINENRSDRALGGQLRTWTCYGFRRGCRTYAHA